MQDLIGCIEIRSLCNPLDHWLTRTSQHQQSYGVRYWPWVFVVIECQWTPLCCPQAYPEYLITYQIMKPDESADGWGGRGWWKCRRRKIRRNAEEECSSYPIYWAFALLTACTKKNIIYTMYKTCRFLSDACFFAVFSIVCFMHFINHGFYHYVMWCDCWVCPFVRKTVS